MLVNGGILTPPVLVSPGGRAVSQGSPILCVKKEKHVTSNIYKSNVSGFFFFLVTT